MDPAVLVLDEPTTGQDADGVARVGAVVEAMRAAGRTVVAITHDMEFAATRFGRIVVMRDGVVVADGPPEPGLRAGEPRPPRLDRPDSAARRPDRRPDGARCRPLRRARACWRRSVGPADRPARDDEEQERRLDDVDAGDDQGDDQRAARRRAPSPRPPPAAATARKTSRTPRIRPGTSSDRRPAAPGRATAG